MIDVIETFRHRRERDPLDAIGLGQRRHRTARAEHADLYRDLLALDAATPEAPPLAPLLGTGEPGDVLLGHPEPPPADSAASRALIFLGAALVTAGVTAFLGW